MQCPPSAQRPSPDQWIPSTSQVSTDPTPPPTPPPPAHHPLPTIDPQPRPIDHSVSLLPPTPTIDPSHRSSPSSSTPSSSQTTTTTPHPLNQNLMPAHQPHHHQFISSSSSSSTQIDSDQPHPLSPNTLPLDSDHHPQSQSQSQPPTSNHHPPGPPPSSSHHHHPLLHSDSNPTVHHHSYFHLKPHTDRILSPQNEPDPSHHRFPSSRPPIHHAPPPPPSESTLTHPSSHLPSLIHRVSQPTSSAPIPARLGFIRDDTLRPISNPTSNHPPIDPASHPQLQPPPLSRSSTQSFRPSTHKPITSPDPIPSSLSHDPVTSKNDHHPYRHHPLNPPLPSSSQPCLSSNSSSRLKISLSLEPHLIPTDAQLVFELKRIISSRTDLSPPPVSPAQDLLPPDSDQIALNSLMLSLLRELSSKLNQTQHLLNQSRLETNALKSLLIDNYSAGSGEIERCLVRSRVTDQAHSSSPQSNLQPLPILNQKPWQIEIADWKPISPNHSTLSLLSSHPTSHPSTQLDLDDLREAMSDNPCFETTSQSSCRSRSQLASPASLASHISESPTPSNPQDLKRPYHSAIKLFNPTGILNGKYRKSAPIPPSSDHCGTSGRQASNDRCPNEPSTTEPPASRSSLPHQRTSSICSSASGLSSQYNSSNFGPRQPNHIVWGFYGWKWNKRHKINASSVSGEVDIDERLDGGESQDPEREVIATQVVDHLGSGPPNRIHHDSNQIGTNPCSSSRPIPQHPDSTRSPNDVASATILAGFFDSLTRRNRAGSGQATPQHAIAQSFATVPSASISTDDPLKGSSPASVNVSSSLVTNRSSSLLLGSSSSINTQITSNGSSSSIDDLTAQPHAVEVTTDVTRRAYPHHFSLASNDSVGSYQEPWNPSSSTSALSSPSNSVLRSNSCSDATPSLGGTERSVVIGLPRTRDIPSSSSTGVVPPLAKLSTDLEIPRESSSVNRRPSIVNLKSPTESSVSTSKALPTFTAHDDPLNQSDRLPLLSMAIGGSSSDRTQLKPVTGTSHGEIAVLGCDGPPLHSNAVGSLASTLDTNDLDVTKLKSEQVSQANLSVRSSKPIPTTSASPMKSNPHIKLTQPATTKSYLSTATGTIGKALGLHASSDNTAILSESEPNLTTLTNPSHGRLASIYFEAFESRSNRSSSRASFSNRTTSSTVAASQASHHPVANLTPSSDSNHSSTSGIPFDSIHQLNLKFLPPLSNCTMELSTFINPQSNPPPFSNLHRDQDAQGTSSMIPGSSPKAWDDEPLVDRFGFIVDAKYGLKLMRKSRDKKKRIARERVAASEAGSSMVSQSSSSGPVASELPPDAAASSGASSASLDSPSSRLIPLSSSGENRKLNSARGEASTEGSDLDHTPMLTTALPIKSQIDVEAELRSLREALGLSPPLKSDGSRNQDDKSVGVGTTAAVEPPIHSILVVDRAAESTTQSIRRLLFQLNEMQNMMERKQMEAWAQFISKRRMKLIKVSNSASQHNPPAASNSISDPSHKTVQANGDLSPASVGVFLGTAQAHGKGCDSVIIPPSGATPNALAPAYVHPNSKSTSSTGDSIKVRDLITCHDDNLIGIASMGLSNDNNKRALKEEWKEFKALVIQGIPISLRPKIWLECSGASELKEPGYYQDLLNLHQGEEGLCLNQIECDVTRTLPTNVYFGGDGPGVSKLRRVLAAMSWHNPLVGYCQGMNMVAATILLTVPSEEDAFWILVCIVDKILPAHYYTSHLLTSQADQRVLKELVKKLLPELGHHFEALDVELPAITFGWFLSLFADALPIQTLLRVFDIFLIDGSLLLFRISLALLKINQSTIMSHDSPASLYAYMRGPMTLSSHHTDRLITVATQEFKDVKNKQILPLRERFVNELKLEMGLD